MSLTNKIGTGLTAIAAVGGVVTYMGCVTEITMANDSVRKSEGVKELAEPLKKEKDDIEGRMTSMEPQYSFCVHGRKNDYLNSVGLQRCNEVADEYAGLEKELEVSQQKYGPLQTKIAEFKIEKQAHSSTAGNFLVYGSLGSFGMLGLAYLLQLSQGFKRKEESQNKSHNKGEGDKQESENLPINKKQNEGA